MIILGSEEGGGGERVIRDVAMNATKMQVTLEGGDERGTGSVFSWKL